MTQIFADESIAKIDTMKVDDVLIYHLKDGFSNKLAHLAQIQINERVARNRYVVRVQKFLAKMYVIRVL